MTVLDDLLRPPTGVNDTPPSRPLHCLHVPHHRRLDRPKRVTGTELDDLTAALGERDVTGREVERVAGLEHLFAVGEPVGDPTREDITPVRALAAVVRQPP